VQKGPLHLEGTRTRPSALPLSWENPHDDRHPAHRAPSHRSARRCALADAGGGLRGRDPERDQHDRRDLRRVRRRRADPQHRPAGTSGPRRHRTGTADARDAMHVLVGSFPRRRIRGRHDLRPSDRRSRPRDAGPETQRLGERRRRLRRAHHRHRRAQGRPRTQRSDHRDRVLHPRMGGG